MPLPPEIRSLIVYAERTGRGREVAIAAIQDFLYAGGDRSPELLVMLARLTYEDAATLMLNRLRAASERAVSLLDEAIEGTEEPNDELREMRKAFQKTAEDERSRERRLEGLLRNPRSGTASELMQLAHQVLMSGKDDGLAAELMTTAAALSAD